MWTKSYNKLFHGVKKQDIWRIWSDVNNWPTWDKELEYCKIDKEFAVGNQFILKPKSGPKIKITLSEVKPNEKFINYCKFLGATMFNEHELEESPDGLRIKSTIRVTGPLSLIWVNLVAKNVANSAPEQMDALVNLAKSR